MLPGMIKPYCLISVGKNFSLKKDEWSYPILFSIHQ